jgi:hypothetical protein
VGCMVKEYLLKCGSIWIVNIPQSNSWCWRKLLRLRCLANQFLQFKVGWEVAYSYGMIGGIWRAFYMRNLVTMLYMMLVEDWMIKFQIY